MKKEDSAKWRKFIQEHVHERHHCYLCHENFNGSGLFHRCGLGTFSCIEQNRDLCLNDYGHVNNCRK